MKVTQKYYTISTEPSYTKSVKEKTTLSEHMIKFPCYMFLDQATHSGCCIFDSNKSLITTLYIEKKKDTDIVNFRKKFRGKLEELVEKFQVQSIFYEGVFAGQNFDTVDVLLSIKHTIEDMCNDLGIKAYGLENTKWKARLSSPTPWNMREDDKIQIKKYVFEYYPNLISLPEDLIDALGMAIAVMFKSSDKLRPLEMKLNKRLGMHLDIVTLQDINELYDRISETKAYKKASDLDIKVFDYDTSIDLETNFRYILSNYDVIAVSLIPDHRYKGQIMFLHNIFPSDLGDGYLVGVASKK